MPGWSGAPHYRSVTPHHPFPLICPAQQSCLARLSADNTGSAKHDKDFTFKTSDSPIGSIRNYLLKYVCKSFYVLTSKFPEKDDKNKMTAGRHLFNALVWKYGWRLIQKLRGLSEVMRYKKPILAIDYHAVDISRPVPGTPRHSELRDYTTIWIKKGSGIQALASIR